MSTLPFLRHSDKGAILEVYVQPKSSKNEVAGIHQGSLKIRLTAPPVEGEANRECIKFLAKVFGVPKSGLAIIQGHKSRQKTILFHDLPLETLDALLRQEIETCKAR